MKRTFAMMLLATSALLISNHEAAAWGQIGHSTIAQVAQNHLTPKAQKALNEYLDGLPLAIIASDADIYRGQWTVDLGFIPTNPEAARVSFVKGFDFSTPLNISPWSHSITVDMDFSVVPLDGLKTFDDSKKFHAVICRKSEPLGHLLFYTCTFKDNPVSSGTGIAT
jgi:hypothetical protein